MQKVSSTDIKSKLKEAKLRRIEYDEKRKGRKILFSMIDVEKEFFFMRYTDKENIFLLKESAISFADENEYALVSFRCTEDKSSGIKCGDTVLILDNTNLYSYIVETISQTSEIVTIKLLTQINKNNMHKEFLYMLEKNGNNMGDGTFTRLKCSYDIFRNWHNVYMYNNTLYIDIKFDADEYECKYLLEILDSTLFILNATNDDTVYIKTSINSPGNILLYINEAVKYVNENWFSILFISLLLFGGEFSVKDVSMKTPSIKNLISYIANIAYERKIKDIEKDTKQEELNSLKLDNQKREIEIKKLENELMSKTKIMIFHAEKLSVEPVDDNKIIDYEEILKRLHTAKK